MPGLLERLFGRRSSPPKRDYHEGPKLAGLDEATARAIELQKRYWRDDPAERAALEEQARTGSGGASGLGGLDWPDALRLHHLRCLELLDATPHLREQLLAPAEVLAELGAAPTPAAEHLGPVRATARALLGRRSPYRPRHGFTWHGAGPPEGEAIPYSDLQGRIVNAALTHLGSLEVLVLDEAFEPAGVDFVAFDEIQTLSLAPRESPEAATQPPFRPARILGEYGLSDRVVLVPLRHGLSWYGHEPSLLMGAGERQVAPVELRGLADPTKALANPEGDRRELTIRAGLQRLEVLSDYAETGLGSATLAEAYQFSLAIDQDDPRFDDKCRGRDLDPRATRGDVVRESRLRASARAAKKRG